MGVLGDSLLFALVAVISVVAVLLHSRRSGKRMVAQVNQVIELSPVGMATVDLVSGRVLRLNQQFEATFHWTLGDLPDLDSWFAHAYPDPTYRNQVQTDWTRATSASITKGTPIPSFDIKVRCGDGTDRVLMVSTAVFDNTAVITFVDRTDQNRAESELLRLNQSLEETVRRRSEELERTHKELAQTEKFAVLGQLTAGMAHELNTPLGAIQSANGINHEFLNTTLPQALGLLKSLTPSEQAFFDKLSTLCRPLGDTLPALPNRSSRRALAKTLADGGWEADDDLVEFALELKLSDEVLAEVCASKRRQQILRLSRDLLTLSRMTRVVSEGVAKAAHVVDALRRYLEPGDDERVRFPLKDQVENLLALFHHKLKLGVEVVLDIDEAITVVGDPHRLNQVWMNLIHNSLQAMGFKGTLTVAARQQTGVTEVEVIDTGPGIPDAIKGRIFEPYFTTKKHGEGLGLGLDLCRKILDDHQGTMRFRSRPGETVFTVTLP